MFVVHSWSLIIWSILKIQKNNGFSALFDVYNNRFFQQLLTSLAMFNNVIISDNCLPFFILYHYFLSSSTINCVNLRSDPEFKLIFTDVVLDFESITQHPDNKNIILKTPIKPNTFNILQLYWRWKRDKWFLNSPSKWNMLKGLKNIYDWYLILTFPTVIFFLKSMRIIL